MTLVEAVLARVEQTPGKTLFTFLADGEEIAGSLTFEELWARAAKVAAQFVEHTEVGDRIVLLYEPGLDYIIAFFACLISGRIAVPVYPPNPRRLEQTLPRLLHIVSDSQPKAFATSSMIRMLAEGLLSSMGVGEVAWCATDDGEDRDPFAARLSGDAGDVAFLQYTSGSTSKPRGVRVTHGNLLNNVGLISNALRASEQTVGISWLPLYHDMGLIGKVITPSVIGCSAVLMSPLDYLRRPTRWLAAVTKFGGTVSAAPNFAYDLCVRKVTDEDLETLDLSTWQVALNGAEPVHTETLQSFQRKFGDVGFRSEAFLPAYGLAESTLIVTGAMNGVKSFEISTNKLEEGVITTDIGDDDEPRALVSSGQVPRDDHAVRIVDPESRRVLADGRVGEIWVTGPSVADGYWQRPDLTGNLFGATLSDDDGREYLRTGDLGFQLGNELVVTGRRKDLMILRGRNIYPQDVEATVQKAHEAVRPGGMAVFSVEGDEGEEAIVVTELERRTRAGRAGDDRRRVETLPEHEVAVRPEVDDVAAAIRLAVLNEHRIDLACIVLIKPGSVPKTSSGKIQRHECRRQYLAGELDEFGRSSQADLVDDDIPTEMPSISVRDLSYVPRARRVEILRTYLAELVAFVVGAGVSRVESAPLMSVGLDSLRAMELQYTLEETLGLRLFPSLLLGGATVAEVAEELANADFGAGVPPGLADISSEVFEEPSEGQLTETIRYEVDRNFEGSTVDDRLGFVEDDNPWGPTPTVEFQVNDEDDDALSWNERGFWLYQATFPQSWAPNIYYAGELPEGSTAETVREIAHRIVDRHDILRARYVVMRGEPRRVTVAINDVVVDEIEATSWQRDELLREFERRASEPFVLDRDPVVRFAFLSRRKRPIVFVALHHIAADFWSLERLIHEFSSELSGQDVAPPKVGYNDFVTWQRKLIRSRRGKWSEKFWRDELDKGVPKLVVPPTRSRSDEARGFGRPFRAKLNPELVAKIDDLATRRKVTRYTFLLAVYQVLLHRFSSQNDFMVGAVAAGRTRRFFRDIMGMFANPLPIRTRLSAATPFAEHLAQTQDTLIHAMDAQEYPLQAMLECFDIQRDGVENPIIQTLFASEQPREGSLEIGANVGGLRTVDLGLGGTVFDFTVMVYQDAAGGEVRIQYNDAKYDEAFVEGFAAAYRELLRYFAAHPDTSVGACGVLPDVDHARVAVWARGRERVLQPQTVHGFFERQAGAYPERIAISGTATWTYGELNARANRLAHRLIAAGVTPGTMVGVEVERSPELIAALYGVMKAGATYVALQPSLPQRRIQYMVDDAQLAFTLTDDVSRRELGGMRMGIDAMDDEELSVDDPKIDVTGDHLAYMLYTSGSTGNPKGVMLPHSAVANLIAVIGMEFPVDDRDVILQKTPYSFDISVSEIFNPLSFGARLVMTPAGAERSPRRLVDAIIEHGVTVLRMTPTELSSLLSVEGVERCTSVQRVLSCGEALTPGVRDAFHNAWRQHAKLFNLWGPTEACVYASRWDCRQSGSPDRVPIGRALPNYTLDCLDETLSRRPVNAQGELYVAGKCLARGYHGMARQTALKYLPDPFTDRRGGRMYQSGDLVQWNPEGQLEFFGRVDDQVQLRGLRVELGEIESYLEQAPGVEHAAVRAISADDGRVESLVGYVVAHEGVKLQAADLRAHLEQFIEAAKIPGRFVELDEMPRTPSGKIDRKQLPVTNVTMRAEERIAPRTPLEEQIATIWKRQLGLKEVGVNENFFELGGHSLLAVRIQYELSRLSGAEVRLDTLFDVPTIEGLAHFIEAGAIGGTEAIGRHDYGDEAPLSAGQNRMWLMQRLSPTTSAFNVPGIVRLKGGVDVDALHGALRDVVDRHEILRTLFPMGDDGPVQKIMDTPDDLPWAVEDLCGTPNASDRGRKLADEAIAQPFDLTTQLPFRALLVELTADEALLALVFHHIAMDEWTTGVLLQDLEAQYSKRIGHSASSNARQDGRTEEWRQAWELSYRDYDVATLADPLFNTSGWASSFSGERYSDDEMRDWLSGTLEPLDSLELGRTLEIGCGTGMVLFRLAPQATQYIGMDFTASSLGYIDAVREQYPERYPNVELVQRPADELDEIGGRFDTIILNSVVQYFPDYAYLDQVIRLALSRLAPGGRLFVGDVRDRRLAYAFHVAIQRERANAETTRDDLRERIHRSLAADEELLIEPTYWTMLARSLSDVAHVDLFVPRAQWPTEMSRFRYSVVLHARNGVEATVPSEIWRWGEGMSAGDLREALNGSQGPVVLTGVPNIRIIEEVRFQQWLHLDGEDRSLAEFDAGGVSGVEPDTLRALAERADFRVTVVPSDDRLGTHFDIVFEPKEGATSWRPLTPLTAQAYPMSTPAPILAETEFDSANALGSLWRRVIAESTAAMAIQRATDNEAETDDTLPIQYADYAIWQREQLEGEAYESSVGFWKEHLRGVSRGIEWPIGRAPTQDADRVAEFVRFELSPDASDRLRAMARGAGTSLFVATYSLFSAYLARYTGDRDPVIGLPVTMRQKPELQELVGFFVNTIPLRADVGMEQSFEGWFREANRRWEASRAHQWLPLDYIVDATGVQRAGGRTPLLEAMFIHLPDYRLGGEFAGLEIHRLDAQVPQAKTDLEVEIRDAGPQLSGFFKYDTTRFDAETIGHMAAQFAEFAEACLSAPERALGAHPVVTAQERAASLDLALGEREDAAPTVSITRMLERVVVEQPDRVALQGADISWTYAQLDERACRVATRLVEAGIRDGARVGVSVERSPQLIAALIGILKTGAAYVSLPPDLPKDRLTYMADDAAVQVIVTDAKGAEIFGDRDTPQVDLAAALESDAGTLPQLEPDPDRISYVLYTSGTTGRPKGVEMRHAAVTNLLWNLQKRGLFEPDDVVLGKTPYGFDVSVSEIFNPLVVGATLVMTPSGAERDPRKLIELMAQHGVTILRSVPTTIALLADEDTLGQCTSLKRVICAGEALKQSVVQTFMQKLDVGIYNLLGATETCIDSTYWDCSPDDETETAPVGGPLDNYRTYVLNDALEPAPRHTDGQLFVGGEALAQGYRNMAAQTAAKFVPDPHCDQPGARMYRTGDVVRWSTETGMVYVGRVDDQLQVRGIRVELGEIEAHLESSPLIKHAAVKPIGAMHGRAESLVAFYVAATDQEPTAAALREHLMGKVQTAIIPGRFVQLDALPRSASGKVDRGALPNPQEIAAPTGPVQLDSEVERKVAKIWSDVLEIGEVGREANFFEVGGNSLAAVKVHRRLETEFDRKIELVELFEHATVRRLADFLTSANGAGATTKAVPRAERRERAGRQRRGMERMRRDRNRPRPGGDET